LPQVGTTQSRRPTFCPTVTKSSCPAKASCNPSADQHLWETGVDIQEHAAPGGGEDFLVADEAHHVDEQLGPAGTFDHLRAARRPIDRPPGHSTA